MAKYQPGTIPEEELIPVGMHTVKVEGAKEVTSGSGKLMLNVRFRVIDTGPTCGLTAWKRFIFGTESDPLAQQPETWTTPRRALREYTEWLAACGVTQSGDTERDAAGTIGNIIQIVVRHQVQTTGNYAGKTNVEVDKFYSVTSAPAKTKSPVSETLQKTATVVTGGGSVQCRDCNWTGPATDYSAHDCDTEIPF